VDECKPLPCAPHPPTLRASQLCCQLCCLHLWRLLPPTRRPRRPDRHHASPRVSPPAASTPPPPPRGRLDAACRPPRLSPTWRRACHKCVPIFPRRLGTRRPHHMVCPTAECHVSTGIVQSRNNTRITLSNPLRAAASSLPKPRTSAAARRRLRPPTRPAHDDHLATLYLELSRPEPQSHYHNQSRMASLSTPTAMLRVTTAVKRTPTPTAARSALPATRTAAVAAAAAKAPAPIYRRAGARRGAAAVRRATEDDTEEDDPADPGGFFGKGDDFDGRAGCTGTPVHYEHTVMEQVVIMGRRMRRERSCTLVHFAQIFLHHEQTVKHYEQPVWERM